jgi:pSer/pThr/pTyr-binding forkhead associated (FHA) protein
MAAATTLGFEAASSLPDLATVALPHRPRLESLDGDPDRQWTIADRPLLFGRQAEGVVALQSAVVSRHHALVMADGAGVWIMDLHSTNGTRVNGHRVERQLLHDGDRVAIGPLQLVFREAREPLAGTHDVESTLSMVPRPVRDAG